MKRFVLLAALALVVAACGDGGASSSQVASLEGDGDTTTVTLLDGVGSDDPEEAMMALTECLRENGVDIADPTVDADGNVQLGQPNFEEGDAEAGRGGGVLREAFQACADLAEGATLGFGQVDQTEVQDTMLEFAACMRDNGVDMPDPDFSGAGPDTGEEDGEPGGGGPFGDLDFDDPVFQAAQEACGDILAGFGPGGGRPGGGPGGGG